jgi:hypothetical protein
MFAEHTKNKRPSNWDKHTKRRPSDKEKGDVRRTPNPNKRPKTSYMFPGKRPILQPFFSPPTLALKTVTAPASVQRTTTIFKTIFNYFFGSAPTEIDNNPWTGDEGIFKFW